MFFDEITPGARLRTDRFEPLFRSPSWRPSESGFSPEVDVLSDGDDIVLRADLPGVTNDDIKLEAEGNQLFLTGERAENKPENSAYIRVERSNGKFARTFTLPPTVDISKISAVFKDGVLEVRLPKTDSAKPRTIAVS